VNAESTPPLDIPLEGTAKEDWMCLPLNYMTHVQYSLPDVCKRLQYPKVPIDNAKKNPEKRGERCNKYFAQYGQ